MFYGGYRFQQCADGFEGLDRKEWRTFANNGVCKARIHKAAPNSTQKRWWPHRTLVTCWRIKQTHVIALRAEVNGHCHCKTAHCVRGFSIGQVHKLCSSFWALPKAVQDSLCLCLP
jgi:hypothetical protein